MAEKILIVVTEPQILAAKQTARLLNLLRAYGFGTAKPSTLVSVNHTRSETTLTISQIEQIVKRPVAMGVPPAMELSSLAQRQNMPMFITQPESLFSQQFTKLDDYIMKHIGTL